MSSIKVVDKPLFIKKQHELTNLLAKVKKGTDGAVELLISTMNAKEEDGVPLKMRLDCATALIDWEVKISDQISKDNLHRTIAEIKAKGITQGGSTEDGQKQLPPTTDFSTIQVVE